MNNPLFTIICPLCKKYECYYAELIDGIKNQTFSDFECLLINDEKDHDFIVAPDDRFKIIILDTKNYVGCNRNLGIEKAIGKYIVFCDADDYFPKNLLQTFHDILEKFDADLVITKATRNENDLIDNHHTIDISNYISDKTEIIDLFFSRYINVENVTKGIVLDGCWGRAYKRQVLIDNAVRFVEEPCRAEDALFENDCAINIKSLYLANDYYGYYWRRNSNSTMRNINSFFYNINPYIKKLKEQSQICNGKYFETLKSYRTDCFFDLFFLFCKFYRLKSITRREFVKKLKNLLHKNSECYLLIRDKTMLRSKSEKILAFTLKLKAYRLSIFIGKLFLKRKEKRQQHK